VRFVEQLKSIGALSDATRRTLYSFVIEQSEPVSRDFAAKQTRIRAHTAKFHLDRLVDDGLLEAEYRRLTGRSGPGAGRPSKLYRRSEQQFSVSLPERRYDLVGHVLADAITRAQNGTPMNEAIHDAAHSAGVCVAEGAECGRDEKLTDVLAAHGYEPRDDGQGLVLTNCPFDSLAREHMELVCSANHAFIQGVADGLGCTQVCACLEPAEGRCCVTLRPS